ncbi:hypothetical protein HFP71_01550 [Streptomyces sp. ARC32]
MKALSSAAAGDRGSAATADANPGRCAASSSSGYCDSSDSRRSTSARS